MRTRKEGKVWTIQRYDAQGSCWHRGQFATDVELWRFLRTGIQGKDVLTLAKEMLRHFESLYGLLSADYMDFSYVPGIGIAKYAQLKGYCGAGKTLLQRASDRGACAT